MRQCAICEKGSVVRGKRSFLRSHYNPTTTSRKYPNLQYATIKGGRKLICMQCLRSLNRKPVVRAVAAKKAVVAK